MQSIPPRYRLPIAALASLAVVLVVVAVVLVANGGPGPTTAPSTTPSAAVTGSPTAATSTPEGAVRAFFEAFARGRKTNDPAAAREFVTSQNSAAYQTVRGLFEAQAQQKRASVISVHRIEGLTTDQAGVTTTVSFRLIEEGYDIDPATGVPLESPVALPVVAVVATVKLMDGRWLVDSYEARS